MSIPFKIAFRYVFSKKKKNLITLITLISVISLMIGSIALTVVLSAFNGLDQLIQSLYESFDADIKLTPKEGKSFMVSPALWHDLQNTPGVDLISKNIEETAFLRYGNKEQIVRIKGVDTNYAQVVKIKNSVVEGSYFFQEQQVSYGVMGYQIANMLGVQLQETKPIKAFAAKRRGHYDVLNPGSYFISLPIYCAGVFAINQDFDKKYLLTSIHFATQLFDYKPLEVSALEFKINSKSSPVQVKKLLQKKWGHLFEVKTRYELNEVIFRANKTEKWVTYLILVLVLIICLFNLVSAITISIIDKRSNARTLHALGFSLQQLRITFFGVGGFITLISCILGIIIGLLICYGQIYFGWLKIQQGVVESYPIFVNYTDIAMIFITILSLGFLFTWLPVLWIIRKPYLQR